jgi:outer membrane protein
MAYGKTAAIWMSVLASVPVGTTARAAELDVRIDPPLPTNATVVVMLFDSADAFAHLRGPVRTVRRTPADTGPLLIPDLPAGEYAAVIYEDRNGNGRLDRNFIGIPTEPIAFSNAYRPKGPPSYVRAAFRVEAGERHSTRAALRPVLGKRGRIGAGIGVLAQSSPYREDDGGVYQVIPAITYTGNRLQIAGPAVQIGLAGSDALRLALVARYRLGAYQEDDSPFLRGMGDRKSTLMAGAAVEADLPAGFELALGYRHDALDRIGGGTAGLGLRRSLQAGLVRLSPSAGVTWISSDVANHDFGVPPRKATMERPAYTAKAAFGWEAGCSVLFDLSERSLCICSLSASFLDEEITNSPIVDKDYVLRGFVAVNYLF